MKKTIIACLAAIIIFMPAIAQTNKIVVSTLAGKDTISRNIYGHFAEHLGRCIYDGFWVGPDSPIPNTRGIRNDVVEAFKEIGIPNLRWPGGCFADQYHWHDGIGNPETRNKTVNLSWGGVVEDNSFGTHEFMDLCQQLNCEPVICGNTGTGTVEEMTKWVEYITSDHETPIVRERKNNGREDSWNLKYFGIGNESWGCGGIMSKEYYSSILKKYSVSAKSFNNTPLYKIAVGPSDANYEWTEYIMKEWNETDDWLKPYMNGLSLHYYTICNDWNNKGSATDFNENEWFSTMSKTLKMDEFISRHVEIMDKYDKENKIGFVVDEWGNWFNPYPGSNGAFLYQQNTLRDALVVSLNCDIFNKHCRRVKMANIAQAVNVLQAPVLTQGDKLVKTPTFYAFKMYRVHHDALLLPTEITCNEYKNNGSGIKSLSSTASKDNSGKINITITNIDPKNSQNTQVILKDGIKYRVIKAEVLTAEKMNAFNDFDKPEAVNIKEFKDFQINSNEIQVNIPSKSIILLTLSE